MNSQLVGRVNILGCPVDNVTMTGAIRQIEGFIVSKKPHQVAVVNANKLYQMSRNAELAAIVRNSDLIIPEWAVVWASHMLGPPLLAHVGGSMLAEALLPVVTARGYRLFMLGARQHVLDVLVNRLQKKHPGLRLVGVRNGYFDESDEPNLVELIRQSEADILYVAMGSPRQEEFIHRNRNRLNVSVAIGLGGTFDVLAGIKRDAPPWARGHGLEWVWRLSQDPRNLWRRYLVTNSWFAANVLARKIRPRRSDG